MYIHTSIHPYIYIYIYTYYNYIGKLGIHEQKKGFEVSKHKGQDIWQKAGKRKIGANEPEMGMQL